MCQSKRAVEQVNYERRFCDKSGLGTSEIPRGTFVNYKDRQYCRLSISVDGRLKLTEDIMTALNLSVGTKLLVIRGSDIAFVMGAKGQLIEMANQYSGEIRMY